MTARLKLLLIAGLSLVLAAVAGWFRPVPGDVPPDTLPAESWRLPTPSALDRANVELASQARSAPWIGPAGAGGGASAGGAESWKLLGVVLDSTDPAALVQAASKPDVLRVKRGGTLPDGARLIAIERGAVVFETEGCQRRRPVYPTSEDESADSTGACGAPQGNKDSGTP